MQSILSDRIRILSAAALLLLSASTVSALEPGNEVRLEALAKAEFVKGAAPTQWQTNQVYVLECWATWCGPCIAAIPHVDALYDKYHAKGLNVVGVNVFEDGKDKVSKFVTKKGEGMSYPVAYTGQGGPFEEQWLKPAGVKGIPHAFVVKNGRLLFTIHPASLTEKMIETLLAGGEAEAALVRKINRAAGSQEEVKALITTYSTQASARDFTAAKATLAKIRDLDEANPSLPALELSFSAAQEKWDVLLAQLDENRSSMGATMLGLQMDSATNAIPSAVFEAMVRNLDGIDASDAIGFGVKAGLLHRLNRKDAAAAAADQAAKAFVSMSQGALQREAFDAYVNSQKTDKPMRLMEAFAVLQKGMPKPAK